jgi:hypothetical protein
MIVLFKPDITVLEGKKVRSILFHTMKMYPEKRAFAILWNVLDVIYTLDSWKKPIFV